MDEAKSTYEQAVNALCHCRLSVAQSLFLLAAKQYSQLAANKNTNMANAAICFLLANSYNDAIACIGMIHFSQLEKSFATVLEEVYEESKKRQETSYWHGMMDDLTAMLAKGFHKDILKLLKQNPYILNSADFARQMRDSCAALGMKEVAELFRRDYEEACDYD